MKAHVKGFQGFPESRHDFGSEYGTWRVKDFHRNENEDVEMFIDLVDETFMMMEDHYEERKRERTKILYLASQLDDDALSCTTSIQVSLER